MIACWCRTGPSGGAGGAVVAICPAVPSRCDGNPGTRSPNDRVTMSCAGRPKSASAARLNVSMRPCSSSVTIASEQFSTTCRIRSSTWRALSDASHAFISCWSMRRIKASPKHPASAAPPGAMSMMIGAERCTSTAAANSSAHPRPSSASPRRHETRCIGIPAPRESNTVMATTSQAGRRVSARPDRSDSNASACNVGPGTAA